MGKNPAKTEIGPAPEENRREALQLVLRGEPDEQREAEIQESLALAQTGGLSLGGLMIARREQRLVGAAWARVLPGRTGALAVPQLVENEPDETAWQLHEAMIDYLAREEAAMAQALLESGEGVDADRLRRSGYRHTADLLYLACFSGSFPKQCPSSRLVFVPFSEAEREKMGRVIRQTYVGSLDCPELDGAREIGDVLRGYRATGRFSPERWLFVQLDGQDVGCLLLAEHSGLDLWELVYMGLIPETRGQRLGLDVARHAQWLTRHAGRDQLVVAVDAANEPAIEMYTAAGFVAWSRRAVFLKLLDSS